MNVTKFKAFAICAILCAAASASAQEPVNEVMERGRQYFADSSGDDAAISALVKKGTDYYEKKELAKAVAEFTEAIRLRPNAAHLYNLRGVAYDDMGEYDKAIADYDAAIRIDPKNPIYPNNREISRKKKADLLAAAAERQAADQKAAETARIAAEKQAAEAARIAADQKAAENARAATEVARVALDVIQTVTGIQTEHRDGKAAVGFAPAAASGGLSFEYRPAGRRSSTGIVYFYRHGKRIEPSTLRVFDSQGRLLKRISISDRGQDSRDGRTVGSWDLTDMNNRLVRYGTYKAAGTIETRDGRSEEISLTIDVR